MQFDQVIVGDHDNLKRLGDQYRKTGLDQSQRHSIANEIVREFTIHNAIEESVLYPTIEKVLPDGSKLTENLRREHNILQKSLNQPQGTEYFNRFDSTLTELLQHDREEETELIPRLKNALSDTQRIELGQQLLNLKNTWNHFDSVIIRDHNLIRQLIHRFNQLTDTNEKKQSLTDLIREINIHSVIEETVIYPEMESVLPDGQTLSNQSRKEHRVIRDQLNSLQHNSDTTHIFNELTHHFTEEENNLFPILNKYVSSSRRVLLGERLQSARRILTNQSNIVGLIASEHETIRHLFQDYTSFELSTEQKNKVLSQLLRRLVTHAGIEESVIYPEAAKILEDGPALIKHAIKEHQYVKQLVHQVEKTNQEQQSVLVTSALNELLKHFREEENDVLPRLQKNLNEQQQIDLVNRFENERNN